MMQAAESTDNVSALPSAHVLPQHSSKPSVNGDLSGFSHGSFHSNRPSAGGFRERHGQHMPAINTARPSHGLPNGTDMQTPGTGYEMNFTPLLPSQLLMGSPFQPGSPSTFASPQFQSFQNFSPQATTNHTQHHVNNVGSPVAAQHGMSPQGYQNVMSPSGMGASPYYNNPQMQAGLYGNMGPNLGSSMHVAPGLVSGTSRTVYLGNIPPDTAAEEILGHVRSGQIESVRLLPDKNCAFISFLDSSSAVHFHSDAILKKLSIRGQDIKIGWGKPSQVPSSVALAVQQSGASRNVYLGNLPQDITEEEIREELGKFGPIDTIKLVREKAIGFVHYLSIGCAIKAVTQLPQEPKWQPPRRVFYGKDRCAYVSKTQQQNAAQYLGIAPGYAHVLNSSDRDLITNALAQQSVAAAAVATAAGGVDNLGNRTVYLGNIHPETTAEEICNVVRGGLLHHIRYIPDKHICFVTFIDPTSAASFYALSNMQGLMIHNRRLKIGWGKHSGALPPAIAMAVSGGASRNVYIGNIDESWSEERLRQDFTEYGEIELVNALREKSCAFVNFTNIANAIKAIEAIRGKEEYKRFKINFGKDRCGNPPRQSQQNHSDQSNQSGSQSNQDGVASPQINGNLQPSRSQSGSAVSPAGSGISRGNGPTPQQLTNGTTNHVNSPSTGGNSGTSNPLTMYLNHLSQQNHSSPYQTQPGQDHTSPNFTPQHVNHHAGSYFGGGSSHASSTSLGRNGSFDNSNSQPFMSHSSSNSFSVNQVNNHGGAPTIGGMLAPQNLSAAARAQHARTISLPAYSQVGYNQGQQVPQTLPNQAYQAFGSAMNSMNGGQGAFGLAIHGDGALPRWAEEEVSS